MTPSTVCAGGGGGPMGRVTAPAPGPHPHLGSALRRHGAA